MLTIKDFIAHMKTKYPETTFYNSTLDSSSDKCVGIYSRTAPRIQAVGEPSSHAVLSVSILVHWTQDSSICEDFALSLYNTLISTVRELTPGGVTILFVEPVDGRPVWSGRDSRNVAEYVIRANIYYERGVS